jgi:REP-associated tyrosine transposase
MFLPMSARQPHRKRVRHFDEPGDFHELTFSCHRRLPLLTNDVWRDMLGVSIARAVERHGYRLAAFVFMPEHVHLLVYPTAGAWPIEKLLKAIKRPYSYRIKRLLATSRSPLPGKLTVR